MEKPANYFVPDPLATYIPHLVGSDRSLQERFIVCGLGELGQHCIVNLKKFSCSPFEVEVTAIDKQREIEWEGDQVPKLLQGPVIYGDCRKEESLNRAGIAQARAILVVTSDESVNVETAIAARRLNPEIQIVIRSSRDGLNALLQRQLGRFMALSATELAAMPFALAGMGEDTLSVFRVGRYRFRVIEEAVQAGDMRFDNQPLHQLHHRYYRLLDLEPQVQPHQPLGWATTASSMFHRWQPHVRVQAGDRVVYVEASESDSVILPTRPMSTYTEQRRIAPRPRWRQGLKNFRRRFNLALWWKAFTRWHRTGEDRSLRQLVLVASVTGVVLWVVGAVVLKQVLQVGWPQAIAMGFTLVLGGYGDVFGGTQRLDVPGWVLFLCLLITLVSILVVLGVLGLLADRLLSSRFAFLQRRPPLPKDNHVIVIGLGRLGQRIIHKLQELNQPCVAVSTQTNPPELSGSVPVLSGDILQELLKANIQTARSLVTATNDQMLNLEAVLMASESHQALTDRFVDSFPLPLRSIVRANNQNFSQNLGALLPHVKVLCPYALAAEAFAAAAFGESILGLFQLAGTTILITEYQVEPKDTLIGKLLATVSYGYGIVPILLITRDTNNKIQQILMPSDEHRLIVGDRLYILSSINGLRRIELGDMTPPRRWRLQADPPFNPDFSLDIGNTLANLSGCDLATARVFMAHLPGSIDLELYDYQAQRLIQILSKQLPFKLVPLQPDAIHSSANCNSY